MILRLFTALLAVVVLVLSCFLFGAQGLPLCIVIFALAMAVARRISLVPFLLMLLVGFLLSAMLLPVVGVTPEAACRWMCSQNLKAIHLALRRYATEWHQLPPPYLADKNGKPAHSWRVLILPYLGQRQLYARYDFAEPWDGPHNRKLFSARPDVFSCPADEAAEARDVGRTSYVAVLGSDGAWRAGKSPGTKGAKQGQDAPATILLAETTDDICWTEPRDIRLNASQTGGKSASAKVSSKHGCYDHEFFYDHESDTPRGAFVVAVDGQVAFLPEKALSDSHLQNLLKRGGLDEAKIDQLPDDQPNRHPRILTTFRWHTCIALPVWLMAVGLLFRAAWRNRTAATPGTPPPSCPSPG